MRRARGPGNCDTARPQPFNRPASVTCVSPSFCTAVDSTGAALTYNGIGWSAPQQVARAEDPVYGGANALVALSCVPGDWCAALDSGGNAAVYQSGSWGSPVAIGGGGLVSVSCPTSTFCAAVDANGRVLLYDGSGWSSPEVIERMRYSLAAVSCTSSTFCVAVDVGGNAFMYNGTRWSGPETIDPGGLLLSVSCPQTTFCVAVDGEGYTVTMEGSAWGSPAPTVTDGEGGLAISCPTTSFCMATGGGSFATDRNGQWSADASDPNYMGLASVSCASASFCAGMSWQNGNAQIYDGSSWSAGTSISDGVGGVSCPTTMFCEAVSAGSAATFDGTTWGSPQNIGAGVVTSVSCPTAGLCQAVDGGGNVFTYTRPSAPEPPADQSAPTISGKATEGQVLSVVHGNWSNSPTAYAHQWEDCNSSGNNCSVIVGATNRTYKLTSADVGSTIVVQEIAANAGGDGAPAYSAATPVVAAGAACMLSAQDTGGGSPCSPSAPVNTSPPVISGNATVGQTLRASTGSWTGTAPLRYTYQWQLCTPTCRRIVRATTSRLKLTRTDRGHRVRVVVSASNVAKLIEATSTRSPTIAPSRAELRSSLLAQLESLDSTGLARTLLARGWYGRKITALEDGSIRVVVRAATGPRTAVATGGIYFSKPGRATFWLGLSPAGRKMLLDDQPLKVTSTATFLHPGLRPVAVRRTFLLRG